MECEGASWLINYVRSKNNILATSYSSDFFFCGNDQLLQQTLSVRHRISASKADFHWIVLDWIGGSQS